MGCGKNPTFFEAGYGCPPDPTDFVPFGALDCADFGDLSRVVGEVEDEVVVG